MEATGSTLLVERVDFGARDRGGCPSWEESTVKQSQLRGRIVLLGLLLAAPATAQKAKDVCGDRPHCIVKGTQRAPKGHEVVELSLGKESGEEEDEDAKCEQKEWWLRRPDKSVVKLLDSCPATGGIGEDEVIVEKNRFTHVVTGGARQRWESVVELQLVPLVWARGEQVSYDALDTEKINRASFNYTTFRGPLDLGVLRDRGGAARPRSRDARGLPQRGMEAHVARALLGGRLLRPAREGAGEGGRPDPRGARPGERAPGGSGGRHLDGAGGEVAHG